MTTAVAGTRRFFLAAIILFSCIGCDQATKSLASQTLKDTPPLSFLAGTIRLEYALNSGGFLSLGSILPEHIRSWFFVGCNVCFMLAICGFLFVNRHGEWKLFIAVSYVLAGGIGNMIDRVSNNGLVTDFINVGIGPLRTGIFNVADVAVMFGCFAVVALIYGERDDDKLTSLESVTGSDCADDSSISNQ